MRLLLLSNGHGEDAIGALLVPHLRARGFAPEALPIVGEGHAYLALDVPLVGPARTMPSGGFVYGRPAALAGDLRSGLAGLTLAQLGALRRGSWPLALAIGDVVPLAFAWWLGAPFGFVGCAKSDLYLGGRPGAYLPHERWLMRRRACRGVWPRDALTTENLRAAGVAAEWLGNPMMDGVAPTGMALPGDPDAPTVLLLPGSRGEAVANLILLRAAARAIAHDQPQTRFLVPVAPGLELGSDDADGPKLHLLPGGFADAAHAAQLVLAMAGTATEQVVGLGLPVISLPGGGPQFTPAFAEAQTRLLGESVTLLPPDPKRIAAEARALLGDPARLRRIAANGQARMGPPGSSARLAAAIAAMGAVSH